MDLNSAWVVYNSRSGMYWRPKDRGYTIELCEAGVYSKKEARDRERREEEVAIRVVDELKKRRFETGTVGGLLGFRSIV